MNLRLFVGSLLLVMSALLLFAHNSEPQDPRMMIVGGRLATAHDIEARFVVAVRYANAQGDRRVCTGSLVGRDLVLTAAHCLVGSSDLEVVLKLDFSDYSAEDSYGVSGFSLPDEFVIDDPLYPKGNPYDIALLRLDRPAPDWAMPALLISQGSAVDKLSRIRAAGYGATSFEKKGESAGMDQVLRLTEIDIDRSVRFESRFFLDQTKGTGACTGDSGGPIYVLQPNDQVAVVGIFIYVFRRRSNSDFCTDGATVLNLGPWRAWLIEQSRLLHGLPQDAPGCPVIIGSYQCQFDGLSAGMELSLHINDGGFSMAMDEGSGYMRRDYTRTGGDFAIDPNPLPNGWASAQYQAWCQNDEVHIDRKVLDERGGGSNIRQTFVPFGTDVQMTMRLETRDGSILAEQTGTCTKLSQTPRF